MLTVILLVPLEVELNLVMQFQLLPVLSDIITVYLEKWISRDSSHRVIMYAQQSYFRKSEGTLPDYHLPRW